MQIPPSHKPRTDRLWRPDAQAPWVVALPPMALERLRMLTSPGDLWKRVKRCVLYAETNHEQIHQLLQITKGLMNWIEPKYKSAKTIRPQLDAMLHDLAACHPSVYPEDTQPVLVIPRDYDDNTAYWSNQSGCFSNVSHAFTPNAGKISLRLQDDLTLVLTLQSILSDEPVTTRAWHERQAFITSDVFKKNKDYCPGAAIPSTLEKLQAIVDLALTVNQKARAHEHLPTIIPALTPMNYGGALESSVANQMLLLVQQSKQNPNQLLPLKSWPGHYMDIHYLANLLPMYHLPWLTPEAQTATVNDSLFQHVHQWLLTTATTLSASLLRVTRASQLPTSRYFNGGITDNNPSSQSSADSAITSFNPINEQQFLSEEFAYKENQRVLAYYEQSTTSPQVAKILRTARINHEGIYNLFKYLCAERLFDKTQTPPVLHLTISPETLIAGSLMLHSIETAGLKVKSRPTLGGVVLDVEQPKHPQAINIQAKLLTLHTHYDQPEPALLVAQWITQLNRLAQENFNLGPLQPERNLTHFMYFLGPALPPDQPEINEQLLLATQPYWGQANSAVQNQLLNLTLAQQHPAVRTNTNSLTSLKNQKSTFRV